MEWISINDKLPQLSINDKWDYKNNYSEKVLVLEKGEYYFAKFKYDISEWMVFGRSGNIQVTHWMPLPEPPKN